MYMYIRVYSIYALLIYSDETPSCILSLYKRP